MNVKLSTNAPYMLLEADTYELSDNLKSAFDCYKQASDLNDPRGCYEFGCFLERHPRYQTNPKILWREFRRAATGGFKQSTEKLAQIIFKGNVPKSEIKALEPETLMRIARCFKRGIGVPKDWERASDLYSRAEDNGARNASGKWKRLQTKINKKQTQEIQQLRNQLDTKIKNEQDQREQQDRLLTQQIEELKQAAEEQSTNTAFELNDIRQSARTRDIKYATQCEQLEKTQDNLIEALQEEITSRNDNDDDILRQMEQYYANLHQGLTTLEQLMAELRKNVTVDLTSIHGSIHSLNETYADRCDKLTSIQSLLIEALDEEALLREEKDKAITERQDRASLELSSLTTALGELDTKYIDRCDQLTQNHDELIEALDEEILLRKACDEDILQQMEQYYTLLEQGINHLQLNLKQESRIRANEVKSLTSSLKEKEQILMNKIELSAANISQECLVREQEDKKLYDRMTKVQANMQAEQKTLQSSLNKELAATVKQAMGGISNDISALRQSIAEVSKRSYVNLAECQKINQILTVMERNIVGVYNVCGDCHFSLRDMTQPLGKWLKNDVYTINGHSVSRGWSGWGI
jgi:hypothetical protein